ncbi:PIR Superfamily Protein [Plasmodium ovale curtisi]|uniref:PIR Superfamily Protein n=1 Tax=Plasmodium ovale curtisi TaxID=864141 RepID=A0A1A8X2I6_PLAOA|nr:PIR Superfamily Protein [Plasmodium ovale curtisi]
MAEGTPDYGFFEHYKDFMDIESEIGENEHNQSILLCSNKISGSSRSSEIMPICKKFVNFFTKLDSKYSQSANTHTSKKYPEFLNCWLNHQLRDKNITAASTFNLYKHIQDNLNYIKASDKLKNKIYEINSTDFDKTNILYELYKILYNFDKLYSNNCSEFLTKLKQYYNKGWKKCYEKRDDKFHTALDLFRKTYEKRLSSISNSCKDKGLLVLPELVSSELSQMTSTSAGKIGLNLTLNKERQFVNELPRITDEYPNLKELLSQQYNLLYEHDRNAHKDRIMKILREFIDYCTKNYGNENLEPFLKEFFSEFYSQKVSHYEDIYLECSRNMKSNHYCTEYQECRKLLGFNLFSLKGNIEDYILSKSKLFKGKNTLKGNPSYEEQEDNAVPNVTPALVGTVVGGFFLSYFLFKFTPFGPWVHRVILKDEEYLPNFDEENFQYLYEYYPEYDYFNPDYENVNIAYYPS